MLRDGGPTGVERRRRWRLEVTLRIIAELEQPGASFAAVARRHEVSRGLLWNWCCQIRRGELMPELMPVFTPVQITADPLLALASPSPSKPAEVPLARRARHVALRQAIGTQPLLWPWPADGWVALSTSQLGYMLDGIDWRNTQHTWRPPTAG